MKIKLELTQDQLNVLNAVLIEIPYRMAAPLINNINKEIQRIHDEAADKREEQSAMDMES